MSADTWRAQALAVIVAVLAECRRDGLGLDETGRRIDAAYPFGPRSHHPYKAWLQARKDALAEAARISAWETGGPVVDPAPALTPLEAYLEGLEGGSSGLARNPDHE